MKKNLNLNWLRTFEAAARHLSFTAASKELRLTQTAVSLQIKSLETKLGTSLFIRRPKSLQLTDIGKAYLASVRDALHTLNLSTEGLFGPGLTTTLVVQAPLALIVWLGPKLGDFQQQYPNIGIKFVSVIWEDGMDTSNIDINIVFAQDESANSNMEKLTNEYLIPISGLKTADTIQSVNDLMNISPIHIVGFNDHWFRYLAEFGLQYDVSSIRLQVDTLIAACEFAACDLGIALVFERFAKSQIVSRFPIKCVGERVHIKQSHYIVTRDSYKENKPESEVFKNWLRSLFKDT